MDLLGSLFRGGVGQGTPRERSTSGNGVACGSGQTGRHVDRPRLADDDRVPRLCIRFRLSDTDWAEDFLFAGASALLLLCVNLCPDYWFASFIALAPLLYRILKAEPGRAFRLGLLFGLSFFGVSLLNLRVISPVFALGKIACGTALLGLFGWVVAWCRNRWGFNPLVVSLLWIALELGVIRLGFPSGLLAEGQASHPLLGGMAALFGFLSISFLIVLLNSLLIYAFGAVVILRTRRRIRRLSLERKWGVFPIPPAVTPQFFLLPLGRAPPLPIC